MPQNRSDQAGLALALKNHEARIRALEANPIVGAGGGSGIMFDTYPQPGDWLYVEATGNNGSGTGIALIADTAAMYTQGDTVGIEARGTGSGTSGDMSLIAYKEIDLVAGFNGTGNIACSLEAPYGLFKVLDQDGQFLFSVGNGAMGDPDVIGFFNMASSPVAQQSTPVTLGDVVALLQAYGLSA